MITGLELTLAVLPLLISAAEHHKKGLRPIKTILSSKSKNDQQVVFYTELHDELALLETTLKGVLRKLPSRSETSELFKLTVDEQAEIEDILGVTARPFNDLLKRLLKCLNDLTSEKSLDLSVASFQDVSQLTALPVLQQPNTRVKLSSMTMYTRLENFSASMKKGTAKATLIERFKFTRNEKSRVVAITKIREANKNMERLLQTSLMEIIHEQHRPISRRTRQGRLRRMSEPLHKKIVDKLGACDKHNLHEARLCLWNCCSQQKQQRSSDSLDLVMSVADVDPPGSHWQEGIILIPAAE
jgi:hypothetical protein